MYVIAYTHRTQKGLHPAATTSIGRSNRLRFCQCFSLVKAKVVTQHLQLATVHKVLSIVNSGHKMLGHVLGVLGRANEHLRTHIV